MKLMELWEVEWAKLFNPHLYQLCVVIYSVVLCNCYRISVWHSRQSEPNIADLYFNM